MWRWTEGTIHHPFIFIYLFFASFHHFSLHCGQEKSCWFCFKGFLCSRSTRPRKYFCRCFEQSKGRFTDLRFPSTFQKCCFFYYYFLSSFSTKFVVQSFCLTLHTDKIKPTQGQSWTSSALKGILVPGSNWRAMLVLKASSLQMEAAKLIVDVKWEKLHMQGKKTKTHKICWFTGWPVL